LNAGAIYNAAHYSTERVNLADEMTLSNSANSGITRHLSNQVEIKSKERRLGSDPRRSGCRLASGVTAAYDDHIKGLIENHKKFP